MMTKTLLIALTGSLLTFSSIHAKEVVTADVSQLSDMEVFGEVNKNFRQYQVKNGKRFITQPYGHTNPTLFIAEITRKFGKPNKVSTRKFKMPHTFVGRSIMRYEYAFPNGHRFSLFEAENFTALGYYAKDGHMVLDVLDGGGAFSAPQLWGPYDQLIGKNYRSHMEMLIGDGKRDNMGTMKASYSIGYTAVLPEEDFSKYGHLYNTAVGNTYELLLKYDVVDTEQEIVSGELFENTNI